MHHHQRNSPTRSASLTLAALLAACTIGLAASAGRAHAQSNDGGPLAQYTTHVVATHYLRGESYETHHYFKGLRDGVLQGLVFRASDSGAALIEVEWAIAEGVYQQLPDWQKSFWHPLRPAVDAGRVRIPGLSGAEERDMLQTVAGLYAQTINLSGIAGGELPVGLEGVAMVTHLTHEEMMRAMGAGR